MFIFTCGREKVRQKATRGRQGWPERQTSSCAQSACLSCKYHHHVTPDFNTEFISSSVQQRELFWWAGEKCFLHNNISLNTTECNTNSYTATSQSRHGSTPLFYKHVSIPALFLSVPLPVPSIHSHHQHLCILLYWNIIFYPLTLYCGVFWLLRHSRVVNNARTRGGLCVFVCDETERVWERYRYRLCEYLLSA